MSFQWNPRFPPERERYEAPPFWFYLVLLVIVEGFAVAMVLRGMPKSGAVPWDNVLRYAVAVPFCAWMTVCFLAYWYMFDIQASQAAEYNRERWRNITSWQRQSRSGVALLDSVILTPEPDLAERMLALEGNAPENSGKVLTLADIAGADGESRLACLLDALFAPLAARLARVAKSGSFEIVIQCANLDVHRAVLAAWARLDLPEAPVVRSLEIGRDVGFAEWWFEEAERPRYTYEQDRTPRYRLLLAWHLHEGGPDVVHKASEAAVALLLGSRALMAEIPDLKRQAWLLRQIPGEADHVDASLASLLNAGQVPTERIRHFWHSGLKGLAQHATLGAVRESGLKVETHPLDAAIGPQAPVARWVIQALAAKMAHFGQGAQLIALPHEQGLSLNLVAKDPAPVDEPWKDEYGYGLLLGPELGAFAFLWAFFMLLPPDTGWGEDKTITTCVCGLFMVGLFFLRHPRIFRSMVESVVDFVAGVIPF